MTEEVHGGRLSIDAYIDTSGVTRGLQQRLNAETKRIRAQIKAEISARGLATDARKAAAEASKTAVVKLRAELDTRGLLTQARTVAAQLRAQVPVKLRAELDAKSVAAARAELAALGHGASAQVDVDADTSGAQAKIEGLRKTESRKSVNVPVKADASAFSKEISTAIMGASKIPALVGGFYLLGSAIVQVGGGLVAMTSAASQASIALAAIPNLIGVAAQGIGTLILGFSGVGDAVSALGKQQGTASADAQSYADAQQQAADSVRAAEQGLAEAEWSAARAHEAARAAQEGLNDARKQAREYIDDLNRSLLEAIHTESAAMNSLQDAREHLQDVKWDKSATEKERRDAEQALKDAKDNLKDARDNKDDLQKEADDANKKGVKNSDIMVAARQKLRDANHAAAQSDIALANAQRALNEANHAAAEAMTQTSTSATLLQKAMDGLSPAGQRFVKFLVGLKPRLKEVKFAVQEALLPPIQRGIEAALPLLDTLQGGLVDTAGRIGGLAERLGHLFGTKTFNTDVGKIMKSNNRALGSFTRAAFNLVQILRDLAVVAGPTLLEPFAKWVRKVTAGWRESVHAARETGALADKFETARERAAQLASIIGHLVGAIFGIGKAATPAGKDLLDSFQGVTAKWDKWANSDAGQKRMQDFFEATKPATEALGRLVASFGELILKLGEDAPITAFANTLTRIVDAVITLMDSPAGPWVGKLIALAGVAGALGLVAGGILKISGSLKKIGKVTGFSKLISGIRGSKDAIDDELPKDKEKGKAMESLGTKAGRAAKTLGGKFVSGAKAAGKAMVGGAKAAGKFALTLGKIALNGARAAASAVASAAKFVIQKAVTLAVSAATKAYAAVQWLLNAAMSANPIGLVVVALALLVGALALAWAKSDKFRAVVTGAFHKVKAAASIAWKWIKGHWPLLLAVLTGPFGLAVLLIVKNWTKIKNAGKAVFGWIKKNWPLLVAILTGPIGLAVFAIWKKWDWIKGKLIWVWEHGIKPMFEAMKDFVTKTIPNAFQDAVDGIKSIWDKLQKIASDPVQFVVDTVWNNGLRKVINLIPGIDDLPEVDFSGFARGGVLPGYTPGRDVHQFYSPTGGRLALSGGEGILVPQLTRWLGGEKAIAVLNAAARKGKGGLEKVLGDVGMFARGGIARFAGGGIVWPTTFRSLSPSYPGHTGVDISIPGDADYGLPVFAAHDGTATNKDFGTASYGNSIWIRGTDGIQTIYGHLSQIIKTGLVKAGETIGAIGSTGRSTGPHLHFEVRPGATRDAALAYLTGATDIQPEAVAQATEEESGWRKIISRIIGMVKNAPHWLGDLGSKYGDWGSMMVGALKSLGGGLRQWFNDKIPNSIRIKHAPDIPLPDNPIPSIFDRGGPLYPGSTYAHNGSGKVETVFTNENIVDLSAHLAQIARGLAAALTDAVGGGGAHGGPLVGELTLVGRPEEQASLWREARHQLTLIGYGGVHAKRAP